MVHMFKTEDGPPLIHSSHAEYTMNEEKISSPHAELQTLLPRLGAMSPNAEWRPAFESRDQAEGLIAAAATEEGRELFLNPVWAIDHDDLANSEIVGWSVTEDVN